MRSPYRSAACVGGTVAALLGLVMSVGGCSAATSEGSGSPDRRTLTVFAAASLTKVFEQIGADVEARHPGLDVTFVFGGSSDLVAQLQHGAPGDVLATADPTTMDKAAKAGVVSGTTTFFTSNVLTIAVPSSNPAGITTFADLAKPTVDVVICAPQVPCGKAAAAAQRAYGVRLAPKSEESSVTAVLAKVSTGEADAGLVYVTDALAARARVDSVPLDKAAATRTRYPIAVLTATERAGTGADAAAFVAAVTGAPGQARLTAAGFGPA